MPSFFSIIRCNGSPRDLLEKERNSSDYNNMNTLTTISLSSPVLLQVTSRHANRRITKKLNGIASAETYSLCLSLLSLLHINTLVPILWSLFGKLGHARLFKEGFYPNAIWLLYLAGLFTALAHTHTRICFSKK